MIQLRPYQQQAEDVCWDYLQHCDGNPALVLPTGAGKSPLMASIAANGYQKKGFRVGIIAHVQELVQQNAAKLRAYWPSAPLGVYSAGLRRRDRFDPIVFMQIQSVAKRAREFGAFDLLLIDEAHRIPLSGDGMYREFIAACRAINPAVRVVGLTATPYRLKGRAIPVCGPDAVLTEIAYEARIPDLIRGGYLSPLVVRGGDTPDLSEVATSGGEYVEAQLSDVMTRGDLVERTVHDICQRAADRRAWIIFCVNVSHAEKVQSSLGRAGISALLVHGGTPKGERKAMIDEFQGGTVRAMVNVNVLSEGFDAPHIDCVAMLRPTKSPGMYYQQVGRGFRLSAGKRECLILDYAGNMIEHGPVDEIRVQTPRKGGAPAEVVTGRSKQCPSCSSLLPFGVRICECGHSFASLAPAHSDRPVEAAVLSLQKQRQIVRHEVQSVAYIRHAKPGKTPSMRVTYQCGLRRISEWVCLEHSGLAKAGAIRWWQARDIGSVPRTVEEALPLAWKLPTPIAITVDETEKYPEILSHEFESTEPRRAAEHDYRDEAGTGGDGVAAGPDPVQRVRSLPGWLVRAVEGGSSRLG